MRFLLILSAGISLWGVSAQAQTMSFEDVLNEAFSNHPDIAASHVKVKISEAGRRQVEGDLDTRYGASIGYSSDISPTTSPFAADETKVSFLSGQVSKPFADGSTLIGTLKYNKAESLYPGSFNPAFLPDPNPSYQHQIDLIYRYPLASGAGNPNYFYQKEAGTHEVKAAEYQVLMLKEQLANQAIGLYFQFILNDLSLKLADDAEVRAKQLLSYQVKREQFGLIEEAERLQAEALLAMRKFQQVQAVASREVSQAALNRFMFKDGDSPLKLKTIPIETQIKTHAQMLDSAEQRRPIFTVLTEQYAAAQARLAMVQDSDEYQLDLVGQVGSRALDASAGTAFGQGFTLDERYISLQLEFGDVLGHNTSRQMIRKAVLALESIKFEKTKALESLETELANITVLLKSGQATLGAAKLQVAAEKKKFAAEMARYQEGRSSTATITQFEGDLRSSQLRALIQKVSLEQTGYRLALALGELPVLKQIPTSQLQTNQMQTRSNP
ncbi:MAG: TolC family protein [Ghiorsea sp.]